MINKGLYNFILGVLVVLVMVSFVSAKGFCAVLMPNEEKHEKPRIEDKSDVAASPGTVERPRLQEKQHVENKQNAVSVKANTTGAGLYKAGYSVGQAVDILDNTYNPSEVRIACIKAGYSAADVDSAISGNGKKVRSRTQFKLQNSNFENGSKGKTNLATTSPGDLTKPALDKTPIPITTSENTNLATTSPGDLTKPALDKTPIPITTSATTNLATTLPGDLTKPAVDKTPIPITTSATTNLATTLPGDLTKPALDKTPIPITTSATTNLATTSPGDLTKPVPETGKPIIGVNKPVPVTGKPVIGVNKPVPETGKPELASPAETYQAVISTIDDINTRVANGEAVSDDEISAAINKMADFLQSNGCNELTDGQQNHLLNKFANFTNNQLFNSDNNKMGTENVLQTLVDTYQARLDGAGNNTTRANVIIRLHGSISKLGACNNTEAKTALLGALTDWTGKNDAKIESMVSDINNFVSNPTADGNNTVGLKAGAVLALVYHNKDTVGADDIMAACASLMKSDSFKDVSHQGTVHWFAAGVINRNIVNDSASAAKVADVATGKTYAGSNASLQLVDAYFSSVKETMVAGGIEGAENAPAFNNFHAAFQSMSCVLNQISGRIGSTGSAERVSEHMFEGVSAETMQSYISEASARIDNSATPANAKVSYANGMVNLLTYGSMGNAKIDVSVGSANFNTVMTSVKGLIADKGTMLKVRDLRTVNNFINAVTELSNLVMMDTSLTTSQKEAYAADFGDLLKGALSFHEGESSVNPSSYVAVNANAKVVVNGLTDNLNSRGYNNLSDILQDKLKGVFQG